MGAEKKRHGETDEQAVRLVLLVAMPMREKYRQILEVFGANISSDAPPIDWTSGDTSSLPRITHHLYFALHMAICVLNKSTWTDPNSTLLQKFQTAKFCDHNGSNISSKKNICRCLEAWPVDSIKTIESMELLGEIFLSDADVDRGKSLDCRLVILISNSEYFSLSGTYGELGIRSGLVELSRFRNPFRLSLDHNKFTAASTYLATLVADAIQEGDYRSPQAGRD
jgi:hypothetical protein